jgi:adenosine deaminase
VAGPRPAEAIRRLPKALLHDHLDGGIRAQTLIELADAVGYRGLPSTDPARLRRAMFDAAGRSTADYLGLFDHTLAVMQEAGAIRRIAYECAEDLAADGVVYAEVRFAPEEHTAGGLTEADVVDAALDGFAAGSHDHGIRVTAILAAMRGSGRASAIARLAVAERYRDVVGFAVAGPPAEADDEAATFAYLQRHEVPYAVPADTAYLDVGGRRLGHGTCITDDVRFDHHGALIGPIAGRLRAEGVALEFCPTADVQAGRVGSLAEHPAGRLDRLGFMVTVNTDNRLICDTTLSAELESVAEANGFDLSDLLRLTSQAVHSSFLTRPEQEALLRDVIGPGFEAVASTETVWRSGALRAGTAAVHGEEHS